MKLYVGNLPFAYDEKDLKELFAKYPSVSSCKLIIDRETGKSRGFGFVEFSSSEEAKSAMSELHDKPLAAGGRSLIVNEARPQEQRSGGGRDNNNRRSY